MKNTKYTNTAIGIVVVSGLLIGVYFYFSNKGAVEVENPIDIFSTSPSTVESSPNIPAEGGTPPKAVAERKPSAGQSEYRSERYKFSLFYPKTIKVEEFDEGGGASTIVFQNPKEGLGFQIFIVPFSGNQITDERFKQDVPSGVRNELRNITVDGASGASFYSENILLGETAEVWFIKNGFLYEVIAPKVLNAWLSEIMQTWHFI